MPVATPEDFPRAFATAFAAQDAAAVAELIAEDAEVLTLTGQWAEGRSAVQAALAAELSGAFAQTRLVSGKAKLRPLGPGAVILHQRYVLSGVVDAQGNELPRIGAMLTAVLAARADGWQALTITFAALDS